MSYLPNLKPIKVVKCPMCGKPYVVSTLIDVQQDVCPSCLAEAKRNTYPGGKVIGNSGAANG